MRKTIFVTLISLFITAGIPASSTFQIAQKVQSPPPAPTPTPVRDAPKVILTDVQTEVGITTLLVAQSTDPEVRWWSPDAGLSFIPVSDLKDSKRMYVVCAAVGKYRVVAWTANGGTPSDAAVCIVTAGNPPPAPGPGPGPGPTPGPSPAPPVPSDGFKLLIVWDSKSPKTPEQDAIKLDQKTLKYLWAKCPKGKDGKTPEYRMWDNRVDVSNEGDWWKKVFARYPGKGQWFYVTNKDGYQEGELPKNADELNAVITKYGG
jgi:hypothetical protein